MKRYAFMQFIHLFLYLCQNDVMRSSAKRKMKRNRTDNVRLIKTLQMNSNV